MTIKLTGLEKKIIEINAQNNKGTKNAKTFEERKKMSGKKNNEKKIILIHFLHIPICRPTNFFCITTFFIGDNFFSRFLRAVFAIFDLLTILHLIL